MKLLLKLYFRFRSGGFSHQDPGGSVAAGTPARKKYGSFGKGSCGFWMLLTLVDSTNYNTFSGFPVHSLLLKDNLQQFSGADRTEMNIRWLNKVSSTSSLTHYTHKNHFRSKKPAESTPKHYSKGRRQGFCEQKFESGNIDKLQHRLLQRCAWREWSEQIPAESTPKHYSKGRRQGYFFLLRDIPLSVSSTRAFL